ncbi:MAG: hypothetical protein NTX11_03970 [Candidatus Saccharibacteria bacterium]|nr:hypothetical protein [Candidatus Saccharibacteria bacterium]
MSFIPDPETSKTTREVAETIGKPSASLGDALIQLEQNGLLRQHNPDIGPIAYSRIEHPMWSVYEAAKTALTGMGIELQSFVDCSE